MPESEIQGASLQEELGKEEVGTGTIVMVLWILSPLKTKKLTKFLNFDLEGKS